MNRFFIFTTLTTTMLLVGCNKLKPTEKAEDTATAVSEWSCTNQENLNHIQAALKKEYLKQIDRSLRQSDYQSDYDILDKINKGLKFEITNVRTLETESGEASKTKLNCESQLVISFPKGLQKRAENAYLEEQKYQGDGECEESCKPYTLNDHFSDSEFNKIRQTLYDNKNLINKKISLIIKSKEIEKEISAKTTELKNSDPNLENENIIQIAGKVMKKSGEFTIIKSYDDKKLYALKKPSENYEIGEEIVISAIKKGKTEISDDASNTMILPVIFEISGSQFEKDGVTKESILQRLNYLKNEKGKIDSLLKLGI